MLRKDDTAPSSEQEVIDATVKFFLRKQNKSYKPGHKARRALHGKSLGTVRAKFAVGELPAELRKGFFGIPGTYDAVVRFSNGSLGPNIPDILPNVRGCALKIYNTGQPNALAEEGFETGHEFECDFLMVNSPTFFVKDIGFIEAIMKKDLGRAATYLPSLISNLVPATNQLVTGLLDADFHTQAPHWFADRACKYALISRKTVASSPAFLERDYLRHGLESDLRKAPGVFDFCVQLKQPDESMEILTQKWNGPMQVLATLEIEQRQDAISESDGEELSFAPARTPTEFQPAGWVGRMRKAVYKADFDWRRRKNEGLH